MRTLAKLGLGLLLCGMAISSGCGRLAREDVPGTYVLKNELGKSTLVMSKDYSYRQDVTFPDGKTASVMGTWSYSDDAWNITFPELYYVSQTGIENRKSFCSLPAEVMWGQKLISFDDDNEVWYIKTH